MQGTYDLHSTNLNHNVARVLDKLPRRISGFTKNYTNVKNTIVFTKSYVSNINRGNLQRTTERVIVEYDKTVEDDNVIETVTIDGREIDDVSNIKAELKEVLSEMADEMNAKEETVKQKQERKPQLHKIDGGDRLHRV